MLKSKTLQKGFTIVELLIVIVVIGILAALVLNTFSGVQKRARDTQRQADVNALSTQLEVYYNDKGGYPLYTQIDTLAEVTAAFPGIDEGAVAAPNGSTFDLVSGAVTTATPNDYGYTPAGCTASVDSCTSYEITWVKEDGTPAVQTKKSLN